MINGKDIFFVQLEVYSMNFITNHSCGKVCKLLKNTNTEIHEIIKVKMQYLKKTHCVNYYQIEQPILPSTCAFATKFRKCFLLLELCHCGELSNIDKSNAFKTFKKWFLLMQMSHFTSISTQNGLTVYMKIYVIFSLEFCIIISFCKLAKQSQNF